jgi:hypothetical protein
MVTVVSSLFIGSAIVALGVLGASRPAAAQDVPERRPVRTVFGAPDPRGESAGGVSATGTLFGSYDDNLLLGSQGSESRVPTLATLPRAQLRGASTGYDTTLFLRLPSEQPTFRASVSSAGRYFPEFGEFVAGRQMADATSSVSAELRRDTSLRFTGSGRYSMNAPPFATAAGISDSDIDLPDAIDSVRLRRTNDLRGLVELEHEWSPRKSAELLAGIHSAQIDGGDRHAIYDLGGRLGITVSQYGAFRASYIRQDIDRDSANYVVHHLNIGGDYQRPLSDTRRAYVAFSGGSAAVESRDRLRLRAIGDADFWYEFKQSWVGALRYRRGVTFIDEVADPLFSDGVSAELTGLLSPRLDFTSSGTFARGVVGLQRDSSYQMYGARSHLRYALSRVIALYAEYLLFHYDFADAIPLTGGLPSAFNRQAVRVGVTLRTQLIDMGRRQ